MQWHQKIRSSLRPSVQTFFLIPRCATFVGHTTRHCFFTGFSWIPANHITDPIITEKKAIKGHQEPCFIVMPLANKIITIWFKDR